MFKLNEINNYEEKKKAVQPQQPASPAPSMDAPLTDTRDNITPLAKPFQQMATDAASKPIPKINHFDMDEVQKNARSQYIQSFDKWSDAEKDGTFSQQEWANKRIEKMVAEGQNPGEYLNVLSLLGDTETPAEKAKREKREALGETFRNLGSLIGNAANLYYTNKGGQYIDLNSVNEKHRERMQRLKDKQDALDEKRKNIIINAKLGDLKNEQTDRLYDKKLKASQAEKDLAYKRDLYKLEVNNAFRLGQIDAQHKKKLDEMAAKGKYQEALEAIRQQNRESLAESNHERIIKREEARGGGSRATVRVPRKDGSGYDEYRKNDLTNPIVISQIYNSLPDDYKSNDKDEQPTLLDMQSAIGKALTDGKITEISSEIEITSKGKKKKSVKGFDDEEKNKKTISGF